MIGSTRSYDAEQLRRISEVTIAHYDRLAEAYWDGTRDHDVNQNYAAAKDANNKGEHRNNDSGDAEIRRIGHQAEKREPIRPPPAAPAYWH
jgi:hypothetical protein